MGMASSTYGRMRNAYKIFVGKLGRPRQIWEVDIKWILWVGGVEWNRFVE
jgi:hypothetical protein